MSGPHRYVSDARHALARVFEQLPAGSRVLLAVSGGADSMALAASAVFAARERAIQLSSLTVDHGIRSDSEREANDVVRFLSQQGIDAHLARVDVGDDAGPEAGARSARYEALAARARELGDAEPVPVLIGHTADDQAETVLLGFGRGSGARSVAGMPESGALPTAPDVPMFRPLLGMRRDALRTVCEELDWPIVDDPSNMPDGPWRAADGSALRRSAIRHRALPALSDALGQDVTSALARTGEMLRSDDDYLTELADQLWPRVISTPAGAAAPAATVVVDCKKLADEPAALRTRVLRRAALEAGARAGELTSWHISGLDMLVTTRDNKLGIDLPGIRAWRDNSQLQLG